MRIFGGAQANVAVIFCVMQEAWMRVGVGRVDMFPRTPDDGEGCDQEQEESNADPDHGAGEHVLVILFEFIVFL